LDLLLPQVKRNAGPISRNIQIRFPSEDPTHRLLRGCGRETHTHISAAFRKPT
jgi:hypothetical protein